LYVLLSATNPTTNRFTSTILSSTQKVLADQIKFLFSIAQQDYYGPLPGQLWRIIAWPLVISVYVQYGCDIGDNNTADHLELLRQLSTVLGSRPMGEAADCILQLQQQRIDSTRKMVGWAEGGHGFPFVG
jgi:hypothetical protein